MHVCKLYTDHENSLLSSVEIKKIPEYALVKQKQTDSDSCSYIILTLKFNFLLIHKTEIDMT